MHKHEPSRLLFILAATALLTGCPDDDTSNDTDATGTTSGDDDGSAGPTTMPPTTTPPTTTVGMTADDTGTPMTDTGEPMTDTGEPMTDTGEPMTDTGMTDTGMTDTGMTDTGTTSGTTGDTGMMAGDGWADCGNETSAVCTELEICLNGPGAGNVCGVPGCVSDADCEAAPATGTAPPACDADLGLCLLDCSAGQTCPDGMTCFNEFACVWPLQAGTCPDEDLGNTVPQTFMGDNGLGDDHEPSCAGQGGGADALLEWTAPAAGTYQFDTAGSIGDTSIFVLDGCGGNEVACNDDIDPGAVNVQSSLQITLEADETVIIGVDSWNGGAGPFLLNISDYEPIAGGSCCVGDSGVGGCDVMAVEDCVCAIDAACCDDMWDAVCVAEATNVCYADCP